LPEFVAMSLEIDVEQGVLESNRVVVTPPMERVGRHELERLQSLSSEAGDVLTFDIETSGYSLK